MVIGDIHVVLPLICLAVGAMLVYLAARLITPRNHWIAVMTAVVFAVALIAQISLMQRTQLDVQTLLNGLTWRNARSSDIVLQADPGSMFLSSITLGLGLCVAVYSGHYMSLDRRIETYYPLLLLMTAGVLGMLMTTDLFNLYLFVELMSLSTYVLVAFRRHIDTAIEAGFKYLIMGSVGTITMLMGITLVFRETGSLIVQQAINTPGVWSRVGLACIWAGLAIKSGIVPVHTWLPDAYSNAPSGIPMLSGIATQSALYILIRVSLGLGFPAHTLGLGVLLCAFLNMIVGNSLALGQTRMNRLLAYSSIAQMGYVMFGLGIGLTYDVPEAIQAGMFYALANVVMKGLAFLNQGVLSFYHQTSTVEGLQGTFYKSRLIAISYAVALVGLSGIPPLAGFTGKWLILAEAVRVQQSLSYVGVAIFLITLLLSLGYYLPAIGMLFTRPKEHEHTDPLHVSRWMSIPVILLTILVFAIGLIPGPWLQWTTHILR